MPCCTAAEVSYEERFSKLITVYSTINPRAISPEEARRGELAKASSMS